MRDLTLVLALVTILAGCNAPTPSATHTSPEVKVAPQVTEPLPKPLPEEEDALTAKDPGVDVDRTAVETALRREAAEKQALGSKVFAAGVAIDGFTHAGTAFNEIHAPEHSCVVLGRLLGKAKLVEPLAVTYKPDFKTATTENASDLRIMGISLDNFAIAVNRILEMSNDERVVEWNLDCAGKLGLPDAFIKQKGKSTFYAVINEGKTLKVLGDIEDGYAQKIIDAIDANPDVEAVALGSGGGLVYEAMKAGAYIRRKGLDTTLYNSCYSACPLVFMAGRQRQIWSPYPELGFHQIYTSNGVAVEINSSVYREIFSYLLRMGIEPRYVLHNMWSSPPQGMTNVNGYDDALCTANVATWVQRGCASKDYVDYSQRRRSSTEE